MRKLDRSKKGKVDGISTDGPKSRKKLEPSEVRGWLLRNYETTKQNDFTCSLNVSRQEVRILVGSTLVWRNQNKRKDQLDKWNGKPVKEDKLPESKIVEVMLIRMDNQRYCRPIKIRFKWWDLQVYPSYCVVTLSESQHLNQTKFRTDPQY